MVPEEPVDLTSQLHDTQDEISRRLGVSQMQVSRLLRRTLDHLRGCLLPPPPGSTSASPGA